ncbi:MAG: hypothetical protein ACI4S2_04625 [Lachnospiraceae bacterium]
MKHLKKISVIILGLVIALWTVGCQRDYDASGYTNAVLDLQFQGDTKAAITYVEGTTQSSLMEMYRGFIDDFVTGYITDGMELSDEQTEEFSDLVSGIFTSMRYEVGEADKIGKKEYEVPVVIQPIDTFIRYQQLLTEDSIIISGKVQSGEYEGSDEEIQSQMMEEIAVNAYNLLEKAYEGSEYGEKQTVILRVKADKNGAYSIDEDDMNNLIVKILRLDEIGG